MLDNRKKKNKQTNEMRCFNEKVKKGDLREISMRKWRGQYSEKTPSQKKNRENEEIKK